jgi:hypothetical protein
MGLNGATELDVWDGSTDTSMKLRIGRSTVRHLTGFVPSSHCLRPRISVDSKCKYGRRPIFRSESRISLPLSIINLYCYLSKTAKIKENILEELPFR